MRYIAVVLLLVLLIAPLSAEMMTNYTFASVSAGTDQGATYAAIKAQDNIFSTSWVSNNPPIDWWQGDYGAGITHTIHGYNITLESAYAVYGPNNWRLVASTDAATWYLVDQRVAQKPYTALINKTYYLQYNVSAYRYYKILMTNSSPALAITEIQFYNMQPPVDNSPPASITNLQNTTACENVTFTWNNPLDSDYSHLYNLFDNIQQTNRTNVTTSAAFTPAAGTHTFSTKTVDLSGNMNTTWVNQSVVISACPTPTPTPTPSTTTTAPSASCTLPTTPPWCAHQDIFFHGVFGDVAGYRVMDNLPERNNTKTITSVSITASDGEKTLGTWLTPAFSSTETKSLAPGLWTFHAYTSASSDAGLTQLKYRVFNRSSSGVITWLFFGQAFSKDINPALVPTHSDTDYARRNYTTFFPGDRLGVQINVSTDNAAARSVYYDVSGNTNASLVSVGYFLCSSCSYGSAPTTAPAVSLPYVVNPTTDKKTDWLKLVWDWWWLPALILFMIWLFGGRR